MNLRSSAFVLAAAIATSSLVTAQTTSTHEQRAHWAEVTHKFESSPLGADAARDAEIVVKQITEVSDFHAVHCASFFKELNDSPYEYHAPILLLYILGGATYQVESGKTDSEGTNLYAFHSVLKGYAAILREHPAAKDEKLDELAKMDAQGKLPYMIEKKGCV